MNVKWFFYLFQCVYIHIICIILYIYFKSTEIEKKSILSRNYEYSFGATVLIEVVFDNIQMNLIIIL